MSQGQAQEVQQMQQRAVEAVVAAVHATSPREQEEAMAFLHNLEQTTGLSVALLSVVRNECDNFSQDCRLLSIIYLKNIVNRRWVQRRDMTEPLADSEKDNLKNYVLSASVMGEQNPKVALQLALLTARIARYDWPSDWSGLLESIFESISSNDWTVSCNATQTFLHVLLVLLSKKLLRAKTQLRTAAVGMLPAFHQLWMRASSLLLAYEGGAGIATTSAAEDTVNALTANMCQLTQHVCACVKILQLLLMLSSTSVTASNESLISTILKDIISHIESYCSTLFCQNGGFQFMFEPGECHAVGWASLKDWEGEDDATDACTASSLLGSLDISATVQASQALLLAGYSSLSVSPPLQATLCLALCQAKAMLSLVVIPLHMHAMSSTRAALSPPCILSLLQLYYSLLVQQYPQGSQVASCEPLTVALTLFLSNSFSHADSALDQFLSPPSSSSTATVMHSLFELLLTRLLRLSPATLIAWSNDPEDLDSALQASAESDSLRSAGEGLFASILHHSPDEVTQLLLTVISDTDRQLGSLQYLQTPSSTVPDEILFWDAVYVCCGLGSYHLSQSEHSSHFTFWLTNVVGKLLTTPFSHSADTPQVLHHRVVWLMSCWGYVLGSEMLKQLFSILVTYLDPLRFDLMVRLQVVRSLGVLIQCESFTSDMILEVLDPLLVHTCHLVTSEVSEAAVQVFVITFFQEIIDTVGTSCKPHLGTLLQHVMPLWGTDSGEESGGQQHLQQEQEDGEFDDQQPNTQCMIRTSLLELFTSFVQIDKGESGANLYTYIEGPLSYATSATDDSAYLCQQGLSLWSALIQNSTALSAHMVTMFQANLPTIFKADLVGADYTELRTTLSLIEGYIVIGGLDFVSSFGDTLASLLHLTVGQVRPRAAPHAIRPVETILLMAGNSSDTPKVMQYLFTTNVMDVLIRPCLAALGTLSCCNNAAAADMYSSLASHFEPFQESDIALVSYLAVCARCILLDSTFMVGCCQHILETSSPPPSPLLWTALSSAAGGGASECGGVGGVLLKGICRLLIEKFDTFGYSKGGIWRRRLSCLALLCLYPSTDVDVLSWLPEVIYIVDDVLSEAASAEGQQKLSQLGTSLISIADDDEDDEESDVTDTIKSPLVSRFEGYLAEDPVLKCSVNAVFVEKIEHLRGLVGEEYLQSKVFSSIDTITLTRILGNEY